MALVQQFNRSTASALRDPVILLSIAQHCISPHILCVCKCWTTVLTSDVAIDSFREVIIKMCPINVPAVFGPIMTFKQMIVLPNYMAVHGQYISSLNEIYSISWEEITEHCINNGDAHWLLGTSTIYDNVSSCALYRRLFARYEQFRVYIKNNVKSTTWAWICCNVPAIYERSSKYGTILADTSKMVIPRNDPFAQQIDDNVYRIYYTIS